MSFRNLKRIAQEIGESLTDEELQEMIDEADRDGDGLINPDEFYRRLINPDEFYRRIAQSKIMTEVLLVRLNR